MAEGLFVGRVYIIVAALVVLVVLARIRVKVARDIAEATERDDGEHWRKLPWEQRAVYLHRMNVISWCFSILVLATLIFGVWSHWYGLRVPL